MILRGMQVLFEVGVSIRKMRGSQENDPPGELGGSQRRLASLQG